VLDQCLWFLDQSETRQPASLAFLQPVLLYLFCDPSYHGHFAAMRAALFDRLLELCAAEGGSRYLTCLDRLMGWQQLENRVSLPEVSQYVVKFFSFLLQAGGQQADSLLR